MIVNLRRLMQVRVDGSVTMSLSLGGAGGQERGRPCSTRLPAAMSISMEDLAPLRARLADSEHTTSEIETLRGEREMIRSRVSDMLEQLEHLSV